MFNSFCTRMWIQILATVELTHAILHLSVLMGVKSVTPSLHFKRLYFGADLFTVLLSYYLTRTNAILVFIHTIIHIGALFYLCGLHSDFYSNIFKLGEQKWQESSSIMKIVYILGTSEDIVTHLLNFYFLCKEIN